MKTWMKILFFAVPVAIGTVAALTLNQRAETRRNLLRHSIGVRIGEHDGVVRRAASAVEAHSVKMDALTVEASNLVFTILGERLVPDEPASVPFLSAPAPAEPPPPRVSPAAPSAKPVETEEDREGAPEGILSPAELRRLREAEQRRREGTAAPTEPAPPPAPGGGAEPVGEVPQPAAGSDAPEVAKPAAGPTRAPDPIRQAGRRVLAAAATVRAEWTTIRFLRTRADDEMRKAGLVREPPALELVSKALRRLADQAVEAEARAVAAVASAEEALSVLRGERDRLKAEERAREEAERLRREAEAQAALAQEEALRAEAFAKEVDDALKRFAVAKAVEAAGTVGNLNLKTAHAKAVVEKAAERARRVHDLWQFMIEQAGKSVFRWGWGAGSGARDVIGADEKAVFYTGGSATWESVGLAAFMRLANHYVDMPTVPQGVKARHRLAQAILFDRYGDKKAAASLRKLAVALSPMLDADAGRLLGEE